MKKRNDIRPVGRQRIKREWLACYGFIAPLIVGLAIFSIYPLIQAIRLSFTSWDGFGKVDLIGIQNYRNLIHDRVVLCEIRNTFLFALYVVPATVVLALILAGLLNSPIRGKSFFRTVYYLPNVTMAVAIGIVWRWLFNSEYGLINQIGKCLGLPNIRWLSGTKYALTAVSVVAVWKGVGYAAVLLLAGLQGIPTILYEAAKVDGANSRQSFFRITIPLVTPTIFFVLVTTLINVFKEFDLIYIFIGTTDSANAGPLAESLRTMAGGIYYRGFGLSKMGYASAEAVVLLVFILSITILQFAMQKHWVNYDV